MKRHIRCPKQPLLQAVDSSSLMFLMFLDMSRIALLQRLTNGLIKVRADTIPIFEEVSSEKVIRLSITRNTLIESTFKHQKDVTHQFF